MMPQSTVETEPTEEPQRALKLARQLFPVKALASETHERGRANSGTMQQTHTHTHTRTHAASGVRVFQLLHLANCCSFSQGGQQPKMLLSDKIKAEEKKSPDRQPWVGKPRWISAKPPSPTHVHTPDAHLKSTELAPFTTVTSRPAPVPVLVPTVVV